MANPHGYPIWFELMTPDPTGAKAFYEPVAGWTIAPTPPGGPDYRMIVAPDGGGVGGVLTIDEAMKAGGATPAWLPYFGVDDVDATAARATSLGATTFVPPTDIPNVGRFALLADPQGAVFYVMRGNSDQDSTAFARQSPGHFAWVELATTDLEGALSFYGELFGWENPETMDMGPMGGYHFLHVGETRHGAAVEQRDAPPRWRSYVSVPDVAASIAAARAGGASVEGPHPIPGGVIATGTDPQGADFAVVGPGDAA